MIVEFDGKKPKVHPTAFVAPTAVLIGDVEVGERSSVWFGAVVRADAGRIRIGGGAGSTRKGMRSWRRNTRNCWGSFP